MAEWSACRTHRPVVTSSSSALRSLAGFVLCRPVFKSSVTLVNSQLRFSVTIKTLSIGLFPGIEPRSHALQSSAPLTELVLTR